nr:MAG TPA: hypothetical protein [Caudoviricetes sp.]
MSFFKELKSSSFLETLGSKLFLTRSYRKDIRCPKGSLQSKLLNVVRNDST